MLSFVNPGKLWSPNHCWNGVHTKTLDLNTFQGGHWWRWWALFPMTKPPPLVGCPLSFFTFADGPFFNLLHTLRFFFFLACIIEIEPSCLFIIAVWWSKNALLFWVRLHGLGGGGFCVGTCHLTKELSLV